MKRLFLFGCLMLMVINAMAYQAMVVEGYSWNVVSSHPITMPNVKKYSTMKQKIEGDSIINGITYKKLWNYYDAQSDNRSLLSLLREDIEEQKVFAYNKGAEVLLYDLGVEVGDTINVWCYLFFLIDKDSVSVKEKEWYFLNLVVDKIDFIEDPIYGSLKVVNYYRADRTGLKGTVYERYGLTTGWALNHYAGLIGAASHRVICAFDENDELVLKREYTITGYGDVEDCYVKTEIGTNVETAQKEENIYYNSQDKMLYVNFEGNESVVIYDAMGKMVMIKEIDLATKSIPLNLISGVYIVTSKNQNIYSKIVVK